MRSTKLQRALRLTSFNGMPQTRRQILAAYDTEIEALQGLTSNQIGAVLRLIHAQYHRGRASTQAEVVDDAVWVGAGVDKLFTLSQLKIFAKSA